MTSIRGSLRAVLVLALSMAGLAVITAQPAAAGQWFTTFARTTWAYTDSRAPLTAFVDPARDLQVGAWRDGDGKLHLSKAYYTFDLTALRGTRIFAAEAFVAEQAAADCAKPRSTELWLTAPATRPTWADEPAELVRMPGPGALPGCLWSRVEWDLTTAVQNAVATGVDRLTFALRVSEERQGDAAYGRRYANDMRITFTYNHRPNVPTELAAEGRPCADGAPPSYLASRTPRLEARMTDPDAQGGFGELVAGRFAVWPADRPQERREFATAEGSSGSVARMTVPDGVIAGEGEYAWQVQADDGYDTSAWSPTCRFVLDTTRPSAAPEVSSDTYPEDSFPGGGGPGVPGVFTFGANGVPDVAGYYYGEFDDYIFVPASTLGGPATVTITPEDSGPGWLVVSSVDRAGNRGPQRFYQYWVRDPSPAVACTPEEAELGVPRECTFSPGMDGVVSYTYQYLDGPETTLPAGADGTASVTVTPPSGESVLTVFSTTADGVRSPVRWQIFFLYTEPAIGCAGDENAGEPLECTFWPTNMSGVVEYTYRLNGGPEVTVPAAEDGTGHATITPDQPGWNEITVVATTSGGLRSSPGTYQVYLFTTPVVTSDVYPFNAGGGGVGVPGDFVFEPGRMPGVVEYVYWFTGGSQTVVPAGPDGRVTVTFTPGRSGWMDLHVYSRAADGTTSDWAYYPFRVNA